MYSSSNSAISRPLDMRLLPALPSGNLEFWPTAAVPVKSMITVLSAKNASRCNACGAKLSQLWPLLQCVTPLPGLRNPVEFLYILMQAGDHTNHDYAMYFSFAGGCCDCGDPTSWKPSGFCPKHTGQTIRQQDTAQLDAIEGTTAKAVLSWAVQELCWAVCTSVKPAGDEPM